MTHRSLIHSVFGRLTLIFLAISLASTLVLYLAVARTVRQQSAQALAREIDTDLAGLSDIYATGGKTELVARIRDRLVLERADGEQGWYLLANAAGQRIAGNLAAWPELSAERSQAGTIHVGGQSFMPAPPCWDRMRGWWWGAAIGAQSSWSSVSAARS